jgi:hypothetical protein
VRSARATVVALVVLASPVAARAAAYHVGAAPPLLGLTVSNVVGDGRLDLVTVARSDFSVRILPGDATVGFAGPIAIASGNEARRAASGDLNGDGIPDLLAIGHDNAIDVRLGLGNGQFGPVARYALRNHGSYFAIADLNGDSFDDVVAAHDGSGQPVYVTAFLGSATGELHQVWELGTAYDASTGVATGDFDHDGKTDVAVGLSDNRGSALVFHGLGTGEFTAPVVVPTVSDDPRTSDGTEGIAAGDLDGDGWDDLVIACFELTNQLVVRRSTPAGFAEPVKIPLSSPLSVALGDLNGDGKLDAVACNIGEGTLSLLLGRGDGTFDAPVTLPASPQPSAVAVADLDGNGIADVAVTDISDDAIWVFLNPAVAGVPAAPRPSILGFALTGPNPIRDLARFHFDLLEPERAHIDVFDVGGRRVPGGINGELAAGPHDVSWATGDLAPGVYEARLSAGGREAVVRFVRAR